MHKIHSEYFKIHPSIHPEYIDNLLWTARGLPNKNLQDAYVDLHCKLLEEQVKADRLQKEIDQLLTRLEES